MWLVFTVITAAVKQVILYSPSSLPPWLLFCIWGKQHKTIQRCLKKNKQTQNSLLVVSIQRLFKEKQRKKKNNKSSCVSIQRCLKRYSADSYSADSYGSGSHSFDRYSADLFLCFYPKVFKEKQHSLVVVFLCKGVKKQVLLCLYLKVFKEKPSFVVFFLFTHTHTHKKKTFKKHLCMLTKEKHPILLFSIQKNTTTLMRGVYRGHQPKVHGGLKMYEMC